MSWNRKYRKCAFNQNILLENLRTVGESSPIPQYGLLSAALPYFFVKRYQSGTPCCLENNTTRYQHNEMLFWCVVTQDWVANLTKNTQTLQRAAWCRLQRCVGELHCVGRVYVCVLVCICVHVGCVFVCVCVGQVGWVQGAQGASL